MQGKKTTVKLSDFNFDLPSELLAQRPSVGRDESRLMVLNRADKSISHHTFKDVIDFFDEGDVMVLNNTKVFLQDFLEQRENGARIEVFLLRELNEEQRLWDVLVDPARKIRIGNKLYFGNDDSLVAEVIDNTTSRGRTLRFLFDGSYSEFRSKLKELGQTHFLNTSNDQLRRRMSSDIKLFMLNTRSRSSPYSRASFFKTPY